MREKQSNGDYYCFHLKNMNFDTNVALQSPFTFKGVYKREGMETLAPVDILKCVFESFQGFGYNLGSSPPPINPLIAPPPRKISMHGHVFFEHSQSSGSSPKSFIKQTLHPGPNQYEEQLSVYSVLLTSFVLFHLAIFFALM